MSGVVFVLALVVADAVEADEVVDAHTLAAALPSALAILLGFADDVLDLEWQLQVRCRRSWRYRYWPR